MTVIFITVKSLIMALCLTACVRDTPTFTTSCNTDTTEGGIRNLIFFSCDWQFGGDVIINGITTPIGAITDYTAWQVGVENSKIVRTPAGIGEKPATELVTQDISACLPPDISGETHTLPFISRFFDNENFDACVFWKDIADNYRDYTVGYQDCGDRIWVMSSTGQTGYKFTLANRSLVIPPTNDEYIEFQFTPSWRQQGWTCPLNVPNIETAFNADVNT